MTETIGPVQILAVGFREGARFEGRIAEQIELLEQAGTIRVLDFVFLHRDATTGALVRMDYEGPDREGSVTMMLEEDSPNGERQPEDGSGARLPLELGRHPRGGRRARPRHVGRLHHLRACLGARAQTGDRRDPGVPFAEGFLTPEAVAAIGG